MHNTLLQHITCRAKYSTLVRVQLVEATPLILSDATPKRREEVDLGVCILSISCTLLDVSGHGKVEHERFNNSIESALLLSSR